MPEAGTLQAGQVREMFDRIAGVYDLLNSAMTAGLHHRWRERAADIAQVRPGARVLDVATGTGDLALELARRVAPGGEVVGSDFSERMLARARAKAQARAVKAQARAIKTQASTAKTQASTAKTQASAAKVQATGAKARMRGATAQPTSAQPTSAQTPGAEVRFEWGDALELPYADDSFDAATVGFGVRNFADLARGLAEMARVVRPGGRVVVLEFTTPTRPPLSLFYRLWFDRVVPLLGRFSADPDAYAYLPESVKRFPGPAALAAEMQRAGLGEVRYVVTAGGIVTIHAGVVPTREGAP